MESKWRPTALLLRFDMNGFGLLGSAREHSLTETAREASSRSRYFAGFPFITSAMLARTARSFCSVTGENQ